MSSAQFSVRWLHRNPVLVTGFIPSAVDWLGVILQIISDGRILSNPLKSIDPQELGLTRPFEWIDTKKSNIALDDFWNDILCPAAVAEETNLYYTRSSWLSQFPLWPGHLTVTDFRALMIAPWLTEHFRFKSVVIIPNAQLFVHDMYSRKRENRSYIRLDALEPLIQARPDFSPVPFENLINMEHSSGQFAAIYAILNRWLAEEMKNNQRIIPIPYSALFKTPYQSFEYLTETLGIKKKRDIGEALKAVRISYDGANYQKIPHSPKNPDSWQTALHPGQVEVIDSVLQSMNCPAEGLIPFDFDHFDSSSSSTNEQREKRRSRSRSSRDSFDSVSDSDLNLLEQDDSSSLDRRSSRSSRSGSSSGSSRSSSRRHRSRSAHQDHDDDDY